MQRTEVAASDLRLKEIKASEKLCNNTRDTARAKARESSSALKLADLKKEKR